MLFCLGAESQPLQERGVAREPGSSEQQLRHYDQRTSTVASGHRSLPAIS